MEGRIKINTVMKLAAVLGYPKVTNGGFPTIVCTYTVPKAIQTYVKSSI